jgi:hypothetical protein
MYPAQSGGSIGRVYAEIKLKLNGASAPTVLAGSSWLDPTKPPTHPGTNLTNVFLRDAWPEVIFIGAELRDDANTGNYASCGSILNEGSTAAPATPIAFTIQTFNAGCSPQNNASGTYGIVIILRNSSTTYGNTP